MQVSSTAYSRVARAVSISLDPLRAGELKTGELKGLCFSCKCLILALTIPTCAIDKHINDYSLGEDETRASTKQKGVSPDFPPLGKPSNSFDLLTVNSICKQDDTRISLSLQLPLASLLKGPFS